MRPLVLSLLLGTPWLLLTACGDGQENPPNPCAGVVCERGQDCVKGVCVDRPDPEPQGCQTNQDCLFHPSGELCDRASGVCVACFTHAHCPDGRSCEAGRCVGTVCTTDADCGADAPYCNEAGNACLACLDDEHCEGDFLCVQGACEPPPPACEENADCEDEALPYCVDGGCVACAEDAHCGEGEGCAEGGLCLSNACTDDEDCAAFPDTSCRGEVCRPGVCDTSADCQDADRPYCLDHACVVCTATEGCGTGETCVDGASCVPRFCEGLDDCPVGSICDGGGCRPADICTDASECLDPRAPHCIDGACVACGSNLECGPWELCRDGACRPLATCGSDGDCAGGFVCQAGACVACRTDAQCPTGTCQDGVCADAPTCSENAECASGFCVMGQCAECEADADCRFGAFCEEGVCVAGPDCGEGLLCPPGEICQDASCVPAECEDDGFEPDQGTAQARPLALRSIASRTICPADEDWFVFTANPGEMVDVSLLQGPDDLDLSLVWFSDDGDRVRHERIGSGGMIAGTLPPAYEGRYYVVVRSHEQAGNYTLLVEPAGDCRDGLDPNGGVNTAYPLVPGRIYEGLRVCGLEHFRVELPAGYRAHFYTFFSEGALEIMAFDGGTNIPGTASPIAERGGGLTRVIPATGANRHLTFRVLTPAGQTPPSEYGVYISLEEAALCEEGEPLLAGGEAIRRVRGATAGSDLVVATACGDFEMARTYEVQLDEDRRFLAELGADFEGARLALLDASCGAEIACQVGGSSRTFLDLAGVEAGAYVLAVGAGATSGGWYDLTVRTEPPMPPPTNDLCEDAAPLDLSTPAVVQGSTVGARADFDAACEISSADVFYDFELTEESRVVFDMESSRSHTLVLIEDACDAPHAPSSPCWKDAQKELLLPAGNYRLGVLASSGRGAAFELGAQIVHTPENDLCSDALPIAKNTVVAGDTSWAYDDSDYDLAQSCTGYLLGGKDVFYAIDLAQDETITITVDPDPAYDVAVYVRGSCAAGASCLAGVDAALKGGQETLEFTAPAGGTYFIVVDGAFGGGPFQIQVE